MLKSKQNKNTITPSIASPIENPQKRELSDYEIKKRVNQLLSGVELENVSNLSIYEIF